MSVCSNKPCKLLHLYGEFLFPAEETEGEAQQRSRDAVRWWDPSHHHRSSGFGEGRQRRDVWWQLWRLLAGRWDAVLWNQHLCSSVWGVTRSEELDAEPIAASASASASTSASSSVGTPALDQRFWAVWSLNNHTVSEKWTLLTERLFNPSASAANLHQICWDHPSWGQTTPQP